MSESDFYLRFSYAAGIGPKRFLTLLTYFKSAKNAWSGTKDEYELVGIKGKIYERFDVYRSHSEFSIKEKKEELKNKNIVFISQIDQLYPKSLFKLSSPPIGLFAKGNIALLEKERIAIAVVGSRKITAYGQSVTYLFAGSMAASGVVIVSGLALGVDAVAHAAALKNKGSTIAVVGNGVDIFYPQENAHLYKKIFEHGGLILSEYPPGSMPTKGSFPARNRIIAALTHAVLVTEAGKGSGALITGAFAQQLTIPVFAVPGPITSQQSIGTAYLLQKGAILVTAPKDILEYLNIFSATTKNQMVDIDSLPLSNEEKNVLKLLHQEAMTLDELSKKNKLPITVLSKIMMTLELKGYVRNNGQGIFAAET